MEQTVDLRSDVLMTVEVEGNDLNITEGQMDPMDKVIVIQYLVESLSKLSRIDPREILEDLKEAYNEDPISEGQTTINYEEEIK